MADIYGTGGDDTRTGGVGNDNIFGYAEGTDPDIETGNDVLFGENGRDNIYGGGGNDTLHGGNLNDSLFGGKGDDHLYGDSDNDWLDGGEGNDVFWVGGNAGGIDTFRGGADMDTVRLYENLTRSEIVLDGTASVEVLDLGGFTLAGSSGSDLYDFSGLSSIVNQTAVIDLGSGNDVFYGHGGADLVNGGNANDTLFGNGGDDQLYGGSGRDRMEGGEGNDIFWIGDVDTDTFVGGNGTDTVRLMNDMVRQTLDLSSASGVEAFDTNGFSFTGSAAGDMFDFSGLSSVVIGRKGLSLLDGSDTFIGHSGSDTVHGGVDEDILEGMAGNDRLDGGWDADTLVGGDGADSFVFSVRLWSAEADTIADFTTVDDRILFDNKAFEKIGLNGKLSRDAFISNTTGRAEDRQDRLIYETDTGRLFYDSNGSRKDGSTLVAELEPGLNISASDFLVI